MKEIKNATDFLNAKKENCMIVFLQDSEVADYIANGSLFLAIKQHSKIQI